MILEHWREEFKGKDCGQVFLHYNDAKKKTAKPNRFDGRPFSRTSQPGIKALQSLKNSLYTLRLVRG